MALLLSKPWYMPFWKLDFELLKADITLYVLSPLISQRKNWQWHFGLIWTSFLHISEYCIKNYIDLLLLEITAKLFLVVEAKNCNFCLVHGVTRSHPIYGPTIVQICLWYPFRTTCNATFTDQKSPLSKTLKETSTLTLISHWTLCARIFKTLFLYFVMFIFFWNF